MLQGLFIIFYKKHTESLYFIFYTSKRKKTFYDFFTHTSHVRSKNSFLCQLRIAYTQYFLCGKITHFERKFSCYNKYGALIFIIKAPYHSFCKKQFFKSFCYLHICLLSYFIEETCLLFSLTFLISVIHQILHHLKL